MKIERFDGQAYYSSTGMDHFSGLVVTYDNGEVIVIYNDTDGTAWTTIAYYAGNELNIQDNLYESNQNYESINEAMRFVLPDWNIYLLDME